MFKILLLFCFLFLGEYQVVVSGESSDGMDIVFTTLMHPITQINRKDLKVF